MQGRINRRFGRAEHLPRFYFLSPQGTSEKEECMTVHLLTPLRMGTIEISNRICFSPHRTNFGRQGRLSRRHIAYYVRRAKGGCGMITMGELSMDPHDRPWDTMIALNHPNAVDDLRQVTAAVQAFNIPILANLNHHGFQSSGAVSRREVWGPSALSDIAFGETAKAMEPEDMATIITCFTKAAQRVQACGFNGIVIDMGQESLLRQFLSLVSNHRQDEYGGSLENRMRLPLAVLKGVREIIGPEFTMGVRLCMDEQFWGGLDLESSLVFARAFAEIVDFMEVCMGTYYNLHMVRPTMHTPPGHTVTLSQALKKEVNIPVIAGHHLGSFNMAGKAVEQGQADAVGVMRALISDPDMPMKLKNKVPDTICHCVRDNRGCVGRTSQSKTIGCIQNPEVGYEVLEDDPVVPPPTTRKKVIVVGAGPAGLEAACTASARGHDVTVYEKNDIIGGQVNLHGKAAGRDPILTVITNLEKRIKSQKVSVITGTDVDPALISREDPDVVIVAAGSSPMETPYPGTYAPPMVLTVPAVLEEKFSVGEKVLFIDEINNHHATATVEYLADQGKKVTLITPDLFVGIELASLGDLYLSRQRLLQKGVLFITDVTVETIQGTQVTAKNIYTHETVIFDDHDTVVLDAGNHVRDDLYTALKGSVKELYRVGDCVAPRGIDMAIFEGRKVGESL